MYVRRGNGDFQPKRRQYSFFFLKILNDIRLKIKDTFIENSSKILFSICKLNLSHMVNLKVVCVYFGRKLKKDKIGLLWCHRNVEFRLIEVEVDWSWCWSKLRLIEAEVDSSWGWFKLRLIEVEVDWSWG